MRLAFDTSVLVAALVEPHPHHQRARPWVQAVTSGGVEGHVSWHALAESWSVLTRLPGTLRLDPATANLVLDRIADHFRLVEVSAAHYRTAMRRCAERALRSGALFDALHLAVAESETVDGFVTFNGVDFERLSKGNSPKILIPPDPPSFSL